ncbi:MAG TPA: hypothetical protein VEI02_09170 [Planctomycetota bacterium]|nr:hypothetical protein [Planctomycetota bacterium]
MNAPPSAPGATPTSWREVLRFWAPVAVYGQILTLSQPAVSAVLTRAPDADAAVPAYFLALHFSVLANSLVLPGLNVATALVRDRAAFFVVRRALFLLGLASFALCAACAAPGLGDLVFAGAMGQSDPRIVEGARRALLVLAFGAPAIAWRGALQGATLAQRGGGRLVTATLGRLVMVVAVAGGLASFAGVDGATAGAAAVTLGLWTEAGALAWRLRADGGRLPEKSSEPPLATSTVLRFAAPLVLGHLAWTLQRPLINAALGRLPDKEATVAAFGLLHGLTLFISAPLWAFQTTSIVFGATARGRRVTARFAAAVSAGVAGAAWLLFLVAGPARFLDALYDLDGPTLALAAPALLFVAVDPLVHGLRSFSSGLLIGAGRTRAAGIAVSFKVGVTALVGALATGSGYAGNGVRLGMGLYVAGTMLDCAALGLASRRLRRSADPALDAPTAPPENRRPPGV